MHCAIYMYCKYKVLALHNPQSYRRQHNFIFSSMYRTFPFCESMSLVNSRPVQDLYFFSKRWFYKGLEHRNFAIPFKHQWEYSHRHFLTLSAIETSASIRAWKQKNVYKYFDFLQRNAKNKVHNSEITFNFYSFLCLCNKWQHW